MICLKRFVRYLNAAAASAVLFLLLLFSKEISAGIQNGISVCVSLVIPSSFLFLVCGEYLSRACSFHPIPSAVSGLLGIPESQADVIVLSMIGGYPVGARILSQRVKDGRISCDTASRMLSYCINPSPAFLYTGIGIGIFKSAEIGAVLLISMLCAVIITMQLNRINREKELSPGTVDAQSESRAYLFVSSVKNGVQITALICGSVVLFSAFVPLIQSVCSSFIPQEFLQYICGLLEVCGGCAQIAEGSVRYPLFTAALFAAVSVSFYRSLLFYIKAESE